MSGRGVWGLFARRPESRPRPRGAVFEGRTAGEAPCSPVVSAAEPGAPPSGRACCVGDCLCVPVGIACCGGGVSGFVSIGRACCAGTRSEPLPLPGRACCAGTRFEPFLSPGASAAWVCVLRLLRYVRSHGIAYDAVRCFARAVRPGVCLRVLGDRALLLRFRCFFCCPRPRVLFSVLASVRVPVLPALVWRRCDVSRETLRGLRETHGECFT